MKKLISITLTLLMVFAMTSAVFAADAYTQIEAATKAARKVKDLTGYNDMTVEEFLSFVKKYVVPEGNETTVSFENSDRDYRIYNATAEKDGMINANVLFTCDVYTRKEWVTIKIPKLTGAEAIKSEDEIKIEEDKSLIVKYLQTVQVINDTTPERLLEGIKMAVVNGTEVSWDKDYEKREATEMWSGFIKGTLNLKLNKEKETVKVNKTIANVLPGKTAEEIIPVSKNNATYENAGFTDVSADAYYAKAVNWAVSEKVTAGTSATTFSPDNTCTRAQILTFLWRASGSPKATSANTFTDVKETDYYYDAALWASEKGMVTGTKFEADTPCTRSATVMYLWQNAGSPEVSLKQMFSDVAISKTYASAVCWAVNNNITSGTSETTFSPDEICSRGQIVTFLFRTVK